MRKPGRLARVLSAGCVAVLVVGVVPLAAQSRISTDVDSTRVTVGDRITLSVTVEHPPTSSVAWPDSLDLSPFEVVGAAPLPDQTDGDRVRSGLVLELAAFELGELEVPSFAVVVSGPDGVADSLATNLVGIEVVSVGVDESGDIRDIRGPLDIPIDMMRLALLVLLPLLLAALLFVAARRLRPRKAGARPVPARPPRPAHEVALEALAALEASRLLDRGEVKEYHIRASDIVRTYVGARFGVDALEMTTHEVLAALAAGGVASGFNEGLAPFLEQCDLVKFAKMRPGPDVSRGMLELGRRVVLDSVPAPEAPPADRSPIQDASAAPAASGVA